MTTTVTVFEAKSSFSRLVAAAEAGETVVISRHGRPVAQLGPIPQHYAPVKFGDLQGRATVPADFDEWTDQDESM